MRIIGPESAPTSLVRGAALQLGATSLFIGDMFEPLWQAALAYGIDPVGMIAQAAKETGWGSFPGKVLPGFCNTAGIKIRNLGATGYPVGDERFAHQQFATWDNGARAHAQHLCAYAGVPVPAAELVDPRYHLVAGKHWCESFEDLSGKWAVPGPTYGPELVAIARKLQGAS